MKLSIIIPVYRVEATLDRCVQSVVNQSYTDFEVILVDDGSPDRCPAMCDEWAANDTRFRVIHQPNGGLSAARNAGIDAARGEFVTFIDSDDYVSTNTFRELMPLTGECDLLEYPIWLYFGSVRQRYLGFKLKTYADSNDYWTETEAYLHTYACNKIYRRSLFDKVRFPVGKVFEDAYTLPRLLRLSPRIMTANCGVYFYCDNSKGITSTAHGSQLRMLLDAHLTSAMPIDDCYYMHLLNIQMDVCELTGDPPLLGKRHIEPAGTLRQRMKAVALNILGIKRICRISKIIHRFKRPSRW